MSIHNDIYSRLEGLETKMIYEFRSTRKLIRTLKPKTSKNGKWIWAINIAQILAIVVGVLKLFSVI